MDYENGTTVDERFKIEGLCSDTGGMGQILFVKDLRQEQTDRLVLKYCKEDNPNLIDRFRREIRLMQNFHDNSKIVDVLYANTKTTPPYFIMPYYKNGDLSKIVSNLKDNYELQESILCSMIDCIQVLHDEGVFHRDIKPQNFLLNDDNEIEVSDFGLGVEINSNTRNTTTRTALGTEGYYPPEFMDGGFKYADARGDIYMLGKSFYYLLTSKDPTHIDSSLINSSLFHIISKACSIKKENRYKDLNDLKQDIALAYNVILNRVKNNYIDAKNLLEHIQGTHNEKELNKFFKIFYFLKDNEKMSLCKELNPYFFFALIELDDSINLIDFLKIYQIMIDKFDYDYDFVDTIGNNLKIILDANDSSNESKALSLDILINVSQLMNRWDSQEICKNFIISIKDDELGESISPIILKNKTSFVSNINIADCKCDTILRSIGTIK